MPSGCTSIPSGTPPAGARRSRLNQPHAAAPGGAKLRAPSAPWRQRCPPNRGRRRRRLGLGRGGLRATPALAATLTVVLVGTRGAHPAGSFAYEYAATPLQSDTEGEFKELPRRGGALQGPDSSAYKPYSPAGSSAGSEDFRSPVGPVQPPARPHRSSAAVRCVRARTRALAGSPRRHAGALCPPRSPPGRGRPSFAVAACGGVAHSLRSAPRRAVPLPSSKLVVAPYFAEARGEGFGDGGGWVAETSARAFPCLRICACRRRCPARAPQRRPGRASDPLARRRSLRTRRRRTQRRRRRHRGRARAQACRCRRRRRRR